ncbi:MFS transporter [Crenobacter sp. HX-7-9]|uniref:MFS transporter n=2 Tax=Crenobacter caeni TaxID=2705474 RepID=A0A6B2KSB0_9NEIS|nr:MFS transporter [Crenobacter caeni]
MTLAAVTSVEFIENGMVMFAATQIMMGLALSVQAFAFAYTLYGVAAIVMLYKHQWMVERLGYRRFVAGSLLCFAVGSALCALADGLAVFAIGRLLQGLGGATFFTAGRMAINDLPERDRFAGTVIFVGSLLGGSALAPMLAALLIAGGGWRAIFAFGVVQAAVVHRLSAAHLSTARTPSHERSREHWGWLLWMCVGVFGLQYAIQAASVTPGALPSLALTAVVSILILAAFAWRQWQNERPIINYRGLMQARYLLGLCLYFAGYCLIGVTGLMVPILLHGVLGLSLLATALLASCGMLASVLVALAHLALSRRWPRHRVYMLSGVALFCAGSLTLALSDGRDWDAIVPAIIVLGMAIPLFVGPVAFGTFSGLHAKVFSHGYQVKNIVRQLGLSSSVAMTTLMLHTLGQNPATTQWLAGWLIPLGAAGVGGVTLLLACKLVFAGLAIGMLPLGALVMRQRIFR